INQYKEKVGKKTFTNFKDSIAVKNLKFAFGDTLILNDINIEILKNYTIAFVGESGSGKTTLVNIIAKLLNPQSGSLLIDGVSINEYNQFSYQKKIGYISQEPAIFNDTIYNNITFWEPKTPENLDRFHKAIKGASLEKFIAEIPQAEEALLGNNGINLSGGQIGRANV